MTSWQKFTPYFFIFWQITDTHEARLTNLNRHSNQTLCVMYAFHFSIFSSHFPWRWRGSSQVGYQNELTFWVNAVFSFFFFKRSQQQVQISLTLLQWRHMSTMASQSTGISIVYSSVCSGIDQRKHQSSASLAFVREIHWWPVKSLHKGPVMWKTFPVDDVIMFRVRSHKCDGVTNLWQLDCLLNSLLS